MARTAAECIIKPSGVVQRLDHFKRSTQEHSRICTVRPSTASNRTPNPLQRPHVCCLDHIVHAEFQTGLDACTHSLCIMQGHYADSSLCADQGPVVKTSAESVPAEHDLPDHPYQQWCGQPAASLPQAGRLRSHARHEHGHLAPHSGKLWEVGCLHLSSYPRNGACQACHKACPPHAQAPCATLWGTRQSRVHLKHLVPQGGKHWTQGSQSLFYSQAPGAPLWEAGLTLLESLLGAGACQACCVSCAALPKP